MTMTSSDALPAAVLKRKAVVYVRQSTQAQVQTNLESQRRQYELVEVARRRGFRDIEVIDDDLGRSASGMVARPGFERLVAWLCAGEVGAVLCFDASRLARNGRDWHHLLELCGLVEARVIDMDGVYDPCRPNDRLLLGMKGSISEFELGVLRARMLDAARAKARRGELRIGVPIGYIWHREVGLGLDPDRRIQEAIRLIDTHDNLILCGPTGVGKSWLACALGHKACRDNRSVLYQRVPKLFPELALARGDGRYARILRGLTGVQLLILDDWGLEPLDAGARRDLYEILEERYGRRSTVLTSQIPVDKWHTFIGDPTYADAILDRLVHNAHRIDLAGESLRCKRSRSIAKD